MLNLSSNRQRVWPQDIQGTHPMSLQKAPWQNQDISYHFTGTLEKSLRACGAHL